MLESEEPNLDLVGEAEYAPPRGEARDVKGWTGPRGRGREGGGCCARARACGATRVSGRRVAGRRGAAAAAGGSVGVRASVGVGVRAMAPPLRRQRGAARVPARELRLVAAQFVVATLSFGVQMPATWPLLHELGGSRGALGLVVGAHPAGALFAALFVCRRVLDGRPGSATRALLCATLPLGAGGAAWALAPLCARGRAVEVLLVAARFASGIGMGLTVTAGRVWVTDSVPAGARALPAGLATLDASQAVGLVLGPALAAACAGALHRRSYTIFGALFVDFATLPGWMVLAGSAGQAAMALVMHVSGGAAGDEASTPLLSADADADADVDAIRSRVRPAAPQALPVGVIACMAVGAVAQCVLCLIETVSVPLLMDENGWDQHRAATAFGALLTVFAVVSVPTFFVAARAANAVGAKAALAGAAVIMAVGQAMVLPWGRDRPSAQCVGGWCAHQPRLPVGQFAVAMLVFAMGFAASSTLVTTTATRSCGAGSKGTALAALVATNNIARIVGAAAFGPAYFHSGPRGAFTVTLGLTVVAITVLAACWTRIGDGRADEDEEDGGEDNGEEDDGEESV